MSELAVAHEVASLSNAALTTLLKAVESEELSLSRHRRVMHDRIDVMHERNGDSPELAALRQEERELSERRLQLHRQITELRLERSRRLARLRSHISLVE